MTILTTIANGASNKDIRETINALLVDVRALKGSTATSTPTPTPTPTPGTVYRVVLLMGQSNMAGRGTYAAGTDTQPANVKQFPNIAADTATYRTITDSIYPLYHPEDHRSAGEIGPGQSIGKAIAATLPAGEVVLLVPCAWGNTSLISTTANAAPSPPQWGVGRSLYEGAIAQANAAIAAAKAINPASGIHSVHWVQGENDTSQDPVAYDTALRSDIADLRSRITGASAATPFVIGSMLPEAIDSQAGKQAIDGKHRGIATDIANCHYLAGPYNSYLTTDDPIVHYNAGGDRALGTLMGKAAVGQPSVWFDKPTVTALEGNSGTIALTFSISRSSPGSALAVPIMFAAGGTDATDFGGTLPAPAPTIPSGVLTVSYAINAAGDTTVEGDESFTQTITAPSGYGLGTRSVAAGTIINDDVSGGGTGTNLVQSPQEFPAWTQNNGATTADQAANPVSGLTNADLFTENSATAAHTLNAPTTGAPTLTAGQTYTFAVDAKKNGRNLQVWVPSALGGAAQVGWANFDLTAGTVGTKGSTSTTAAISSLGNGWYRCSVTISVTAAAAATFNVSGSNNTADLARAGSYTGSGAGGFYLANAQIVTGSIANAF